jgi:pimeloyl-ACP methyl ester carboxylesterase
MARIKIQRFSRGLVIVTVIMFMPINVCSQEKLDTRGKNSRLEIKPDKILCQGKEYDGMRGTLYVPESRAKAESGIIELPVVVVKSINPNPDYPIFQFTGGPGLSNIAPGEHINEEDLKNHDVVEVGYRGVDGTPNLKHPLFDEIFRTLDMLSRSSLKKIGQIATQAVKELQAKGIDVAEYNIQNVVEDMEVARAALGYEKINITGGSYGGAVVMVYCLRYPERIHRAIMIEAAFPYDIAFGRPEEFDKRLNHLNQLWRKDPEALKRSPDIVQTMRNVLKNMPQEWNGLPIDPSKVRFMTYFGITSQRSYVNMTFDAYVCAENGDFTNIALLSMMYDHFFAKMGNTGDLLAKTFSSVTNPDRDFISELENRDSVIGSPLSMLAWGGFQYSNWPVKPFPVEYPELQKSNVETLIIYGSKETGEPFREKYADAFTNARWVILDDLAHMDIWTITGQVVHHLMLRFLDAGLADTSKIVTPSKWNFTPEVTFQQTFEQITQQSDKTKKTGYNADNNETLEKR